MKTIIAFFFFIFIARICIAQNQIQQTPPSPQTDTTSGWQLVFSNPAYTFTYLKLFPSPENTIGYAVCANGKTHLLLKTTDLGLTWDSLSTPVPAVTVTFVNSQLGFCTGGNADSVWKTTNGGQSWQSTYRNTSHNGQLVFSNSDTGLVISGNGEVARTTDGGKTWSDIFAETDNCTGASFGDQRTCYAVGDLGPFYPGKPSDPWTGFCMKTTDAGLTWTQLNTGLKEYLGCCQAFDANTLYLGSWSINFAKTTDGGNTWDTIPVSGPNGGFSALSFINKKHGLMVGGDVINHVHFGIIFVTNDSGKNWMQQNIPNAPSLDGTQMLNDSIAFAYGGGNIYRTITGGNFSSVNLHRIDFHVKTFPNPSTGKISIQYQLPSAEPISLRFFNIQGITVGSINEAMQESGIHEAFFNASALPNGAYYLILTAGANQQTVSFSIQR